MNIYNIGDNRLCYEIRLWDDIMLEISIDIQLMDNSVNPHAFTVCE